jgi:hypothetical protein
MHKTRAAAALICIAATNAFVAPQRSVARPSSSHAQPTAPAALRQQTYACSARIKTSRHISNHARTPRRRRGHNRTARRPSHSLTRRQLNMVIPGDSAAVESCVEINQ